jgi:hypothetical protein
MLWLYPERRPDTSAGAIARVGAVLAACIPVGGAAIAAQVYVQPAAEVRAEVDSNRALATADKKTSEGYSANLGLTVGIVTPRSDTTIKPQLGYSDYPRDKEHSALGLLEVSSNYLSPRSDFSVYGMFDSRDTFYSELASAVFNPLNPNNPTTPETGRLSADTKRALGSINPTYKYALTQRTSIGVTGIYQITNYSGTSAANYAGYDYSLANVFLGWDLNPRSQMSVGVFGSRDHARTGSDGVTDGKGVNLAFNFNWTKKFTSRLELKDEQDNFKQAVPAPVRTRSNNIAGTYYTTWTGQVSRLQLDVGRTVTPSGAVGLYRADQLQVEYSRQLSARLTADYAARYIRYSSTLAAQNTNFDYDYVTATAGLRWLASRTWYVAGGLEYYRVDNRSVAVTGNNGLVYVSFGYQGLGRRP